LTSAVKAKSALPQNPVTQPLYDHATCSRRDEVAQPTLEIDYEDDEVDEDDPHDSGRHPTLFRESSFEPTPRGSSLRQKVTSHAQLFSITGCIFPAVGKHPLVYNFFLSGLPRTKRVRCCIKYLFMHSTSPSTVGCNFWKAKCILTAEFSSSN
jgi:hypothetical protein